MKKLVILVAFAVIAGIGAAAMLLPSPSAAQTQAQHEAAQMRTVSFAIDNMTCAACPITVRTAMSRVEGVRSVEVDFDAKLATVRYDAARATPAAIAQASTDAGYPARLIEAASPS